MDIRHLVVVFGCLMILVLSISAQAQSKITISKNQNAVVVDGKKIEFPATLKDLDQFFPAETKANAGISTQFFFGDANYAGALYFKNPKISVVTEEGARVGMTQEELHGLYGKPNYVFPLRKEDTYFFNKLDHQFGNNESRYAFSLGFIIDQKKTVTGMVVKILDPKVLLDSTNNLTKKENVMNKNVVEKDEIVTTKEGAVTFLAPKVFDRRISREFKPGEYRFSYMMMDSNTPSMSVMMMNATKAVTQKTLQERMDALIGDVKKVHEQHGKMMKLEPLTSESFKKETVQLSSKSFQKLTYFQKDGSQTIVNETYLMGKGMKILQVSVSYLENQKPSWYDTFFQMLKVNLDKM